MREPENVTGGAADILPHWLAGLQFGESIRHQTLALVPVHGSGEIRTLAYRTLAEAIELGAVLVTEAPQATVPTLRLVNKGELLVLVIDGEEVVGACRTGS